MGFAWNRGVLVVRDSASLILGSGAAAVANLVALGILAHRLEPSLFGVYASIMIAMTGAAVLADLGLSQVVIREGVRNPGGFEPLLRKALESKLASIGVAGLAVAAYAILIQDVTVRLAAGLCIAVACGSVNLSLQAACNVRGAFGRLGVLRFMETSLPGAASAAGVFLGGLDGAIVGLVVGTVAALGFTGALSPVRIRALWPSTARISLELARPAIWFFGLILVTILTGRATVVLLGPVLGAAGLGIYAAAIRLNDALLLVAGNIMAVLYPRAIKTYSEQASSQAELSKLTLAWGAFGLVAWVGLAFALPLLTRLILGDEFAQAASVLRVLALTFPIAMMAMPYSLLADSTNHQRLNLLGGLVTVPAAIGLALLGAGWAGALGAALGLVIARLFGLALGFTLVARYVAAPVQAA
jgi:O-antigen/teichoic acid export membrane protein